MVTATLQVQKVCEMLYGNEADYIDWRQFLVFVAHPSPMPTTDQLVEADKQFSQVGSEGKVTWEQYQSVEAWFTEDPDTSPDHFNRSEELRKVCAVHLPQHTMQSVNPTYPISGIF